MTVVTMQLGLSAHSDALLIGMAQASSVLHDIMQDVERFLA